MKLIELRLSDFAHFTSRQFSLQPGANLVTGANRSGKTVFIRALEAAFAERLPDTFRNSTAGQPAAVAVKFENAGGAQLLERVFDGTPEEVATSLAEVPLALLLHAGFWREGGLLALAPDQLAALLRRLSLAGAEAETSPLPLLQHEYRRLTARDPWGEDGEPGELEKLRERLAEIEICWEQRLEALKLLGTLQAEAPPAAAEAPAEVLLTPPKVEASVATPSAETPLPDFETHTEQPVNNVVLSVGDDDWPEALCDDARESDPRKVRERLWAVQKQAASLRQELVSVPSLSPLLPSVLTLLFVLLSGALALFQRDLWQAAGLSGAVLTLCTWAVFAFLSRNKGSELGRLREQLTAAENERESLLQELDRLDEQRRYGASDETDDALSDYNDSDSEVAERADTPLSLPVAQEPAPETEPSASEDLPRVSPWQQRRRLLNEVSDLRALEMEGETLRYREQQIVTRLKVLTTAIEMLLQAEDGFGGERRTALSGQINRQLQALLPGSALQCELSSGWQLLLTDTSVERPLTPQMLSRGEKTLLSLALHLALLTVSGAPQLPLFADDLCDDLQQDLRDNALKVLNRFSQTQQLVLTSRDPDLLKRAASLGWTIISLDESDRPPRATKQTSSPERSDDEQQLHLL